jgi:hypothetical protein
MKETTTTTQTSPYSRARSREFVPELRAFDMNGRRIFYTTGGYQVKPQQKEEQLAFQKVSAVLSKVIQKEVSF